MAGDFHYILYMIYNGVKKCFKFNQSFLDTWLMFDTLTVMDELTLLIVWNMLFLAPIMKLQFLFGFITVPTQNNTFINMNTPFFPNSLEYHLSIQNADFWLLSSLALLIIYSNSRFLINRNQRSAVHLISAINELYKKFKSHVRSIVSFIFFLDKSIIHYCREE